MLLAAFAPSRARAQVTLPVPAAASHQSASRESTVPTLAFAVMVAEDSSLDAALRHALRRSNPTATARADVRREHAPWWSPIASAVVPGSGQAVLGQDRWLAFAAVEGMALVRYATDLREARRQRREYRSLADRVARAMYGGTRPVGDFAYYEHMERYVESGVFDEVPGGALDPETDSATFNGATWLLARQTYWPDPEVPPAPGSVEYERAVAFYLQRAVGPEFRWSWRDAQLEQDLFRRAIAGSNAAFRRSAQDVAVLLANHVLSTVDAYVTLRIRRGARRRDAPGGTMELGAELPWPRAGERLFAPARTDRQ